MAPNRDKPLFSVLIRTTPKFAPFVEEGLRLVGAGAVSCEDVERGAVTFEEYFAERHRAAACASQRRAQLAAWSEGDAWCVAVRRIPAQDWSESWKRFFRTERVSPRIVIKPSWETCRARAGDCVIELDPGLSFGTGMHFTTRSCLRWIDAGSLRGERGRLLDLGCGSGILSIAAAKLGFREVLAIDNDPEAVRVASENVRRNGVADRVQCRCGDVARLGRIGVFDGIVANILAGTLCAHSGPIARRLKRAPGSFLCLAGILAPQYAAVRDSYERRGLRQVETATDHEWMSGCFSA